MSHRHRSWIPIFTLCTLISHGAAHGAVRTKEVCGTPASFSRVDACFSGGPCTVGIRGAFLDLTDKVTVVAGSAAATIGSKGTDQNVFGCVPNGNSSREGFIIIELSNIQNAGNLRLKMERPALTGRDSDTVTVEVKNGDTFLNRSSPGSVEVGVSRNFDLRGRGLDKLRLGGPGLVQSVRDTPRDVSASRLEGPLSEVDAILSQSPTDARVRLTFFQAAAKVSLEQKLRFEGGEPELNRTQGWPEVEVRAARPPPGLPRITVTLFGTGTGSVTSDPRTITCPGTCTGEFPTNTNVGMTAVARPGSRFKGWSPAVDTCSGATSPCTINNASTPRPSYALRAEFVKLFHLTVVKAGAGGTVTGGAEPNRIACGQVCGTDFTEPNASITLEAVGDSGNRFTGWSGACTGTGPCRVSMSGNDQRVTATFVDLSP